MLQILRSYLFVPGSRPDRFDKALAAGADAVVIDLEDAVPPSEKVAARERVARWRHRIFEIDRKSTRLNSSHSAKSRMPSSA